MYGDEIDRLKIKNRERKDFKIPNLKVYNSKTNA